MDVKDKVHVLIEGCEQQVANEICTNFLQDTAQDKVFLIKKDWLQQTKAKNNVTKRKAFWRELKKNRIARSQGQNKQV